jgi:hypothetical protein
MKGKSGSVVAGPLIFFVFFVCGGGAVFQGGFREKWCFGVVILW